MKPLKMDEVWRILPPLDELRPVLDHLLARSVPDPDRTWSASGEVGTAGDRLVGPEDAELDPAALAEEARRHTEAVFLAVTEAVRFLTLAQGTAAAAAFLEAAGLEEEHGRPDRARAYAISAYQAARDEKDQGPAGLALRRWGRAARALGELEEAGVRYTRGYEIARALLDHRGAAEAAIGAGNVLEDQGRWEEAERWYHRALQILEPVEGYAPERWQAFLNLHIALRSRGRGEESLPWLERAETVANEGRDSSARPFLENARGQLQTLFQDFSGAEARFRDALEVSPGPAATVTIRLNLAEALLAQDRRLEAAEEARSAEAEALAGGVVPALPEVYRLLGRIAARNGNPHAFVLFERALEIVRDRKLPELEVAVTLQAYAEAEAARGEEEAARELHDKAEERYRSLGIPYPRHPWTQFFGPGHERHDTHPDEQTPHA